MRYLVVIMLLLLVGCKEKTQVDLVQDEMNKLLNDREYLVMMTYSYQDILARVKQGETPQRALKRSNAYLEMDQFMWSMFKKHNINPALTAEVLQLVQEQQWGATNMALLCK